MGAVSSEAAFITQLARELHRAGVATDQLENTIGPIASTLGLQTEIFALPTNVTIAIGPPHAQQIIMLRLEPAHPNLRKLALLNEIFDELQGGNITLDSATALLRSLDDRCPPPNAIASVLALAAVATGVATLLGGGLHELLVAALIGSCTGVLAYFTTRNATMDRLFQFFAAFAATLIVAAYMHFVGPVNLYIAIVAGVVVLLPGYSLTLALHELANEDLIAGTARLGRVLAILLALGCGAILGFAITGSSLLQTGDVHPHPVAPAFWLPAIVLLATGLSIELDARLRDYPWVLLACLVAMGSQFYFNMLPAHQVTPFIAALICGLVANGAARYLRVPQPIMLVPALHVLVPGALSYQSVLWVVSRNYSDAASLATSAVLAAILIVAGLLLSQLLVPAAPLRLKASR
ncbi:MAG: threonine/serine exporter ThrE family protein [Candidatus Baltobacteraceae bacterium]